MSTAYVTDHIRTIDLDHEQLLVLSDQRGARVQVLFGGLWLTEEGCLEDRFANAGQWLQLEARGRAVAEALGPSRVRVFEPARRVAAGWRHALWNWRPSVSTLAMRGLAATLALMLSLVLPELMARGFLGHADAAQADLAARVSQRSAAG